MLYAFMEKILSQPLLWHVVQPSINSISLHAFGEVTSLATSSGCLKINVLDKRNDVDKF